MLFDKRHVRFTLREEALLIDGIRKIELAHAHQLTPDDEATLEIFREDFIARDLDLYRTTWKQIEMMFDAHGIKIPVDASYQRRWHATRKAYYMTNGSGSYYPLFGKKETPEVRIGRRQKKRLAAWDKAGTIYNDMGNLTMEDETTKGYDKELAAMEQRLKEMKREMAKAVGTAEIINISDYLNRGEEK